MISNAAVLHPADVLELEEEDFDRVVRVNLKGFFLTGQAAARADGRAGPRRGDHPHVVDPGVHHQCEPALLRGVQGRGEAAHGGDGAGPRTQEIRVNAIGPGSIATDMVMQLISSDEARRTVMSRTPMGRLGKPEEIAAVAAFLASDEASYITGETVVADGGRLGLNYVVPVTD